MPCRQHPPYRIAPCVNKFNGAGAVKRTLSGVPVPALARNVHRISRYRLQVLDLPRLYQKFMKSVDNFVDIPCGRHARPCQQRAGVRLHAKRAMGGCLCKSRTCRHLPAAGARSIEFFKNGAACAQLQLSSTAWMGLGVLFFASTHIASRTLPSCGA